MALFSSVRELDVVEGPMHGAFAGRTFVASWQEDGRDLLAKWASRSGAPELVTPLDPRVVSLAASPDGERVAVAGLTGDHVELLVATLAPPSGVRLIQPGAGLSFEADAKARLLWSEDGRRLALGGLLGTSADHVLTTVFDLGATPPTTSVVFGRPAAWQGARLCVALADARSAWDAERDAEVAWDGTLRFASPDASATVVRGADGAVEIETGGETRPLVNAPAEVAWVGPHHLATDDGRALDVLTRRTLDVLPRGGGATLVALSRDGRSGVFARNGAALWAADPT